MRRGRARARRLARIRLLKTLGLFTPYVIADVDGLLFLVGTRGSGVARAMFVRGRRPEFPGLERTLRVLEERGQTVKGTTLVDVGANVGTTTVAAIIRHGFGYAVAVEPNPANVTALFTNIALNGLSDCTRVVAAAASDQAGRATFTQKASDGTGRLIMDSANGVEVAVIRLDDEVDAQDVGLLWIDTQGHELEVLRGAPELLARRPPIVAAFRVSKGNTSELLEFLAGAGYQSFIDLREPNIYNPDWSPTIHELAGEFDYAPHKATDLLFLA